MEAGGLVSVDGKGGTMAVPKGENEAGVRGSRGIILRDWDTFPVDAAGGKSTGGVILLG
jgi:hypothetical protein